MKCNFVLHTTIQYKIGAIFFTLIMTAPFYFVFIVNDLIIKLAIAIIALFIVVSTIKKIIVPFWDNYLRFDEIGVRGIVQSSKIDLKWEDVKAVWQPRAASVSQYITFITSYGYQEIFIRHFDRKRIWDAVRNSINPDALKSETYRTLSEYKRLSSNLNRLLPQFTYPLRSNQYPARVVVWLGLVFFSLCVVFYMKYLACGVPFFGLFVLLYVLFLAGVGNLEIDPQGVTHWAWLGKYHMKWNEIQKIMQDPSGGWMVLYGNDKSLTIPGPSMWAGKHKDILHLFFLYKISENDIELIESIWANFKIFNRNTRTR